MKVIHNKIPGNLLNVADFLFFLPDKKSLRKSVIRVEPKHEITFCGKSDDDCIFVKGLIRSKDDSFKSVCLFFYPIKEKS